MQLVFLGVIQEAGLKEPRETGKEEKQTEQNFIEIVVAGNGSSI